MPFSPDEERRVRRIEERLTDVTKRVTELEERRGDFENAAKRWVGEAVTHAVTRELAPLHADIAELKADNKAQLELLREAAEERGRRKQREEDAEHARKQAELALATRKVSVDEKKVDADLDTARRDARVRKWTPILVLVGTLLTVAGAIITALLRQ